MATARDTFTLRVIGTERKIAPTINVLPGSDSTKTITVAQGQQWGAPFNYSVGFPAATSFGFQTNAKPASAADIAGTINPNTPAREYDHDNDSSTADIPVDAYVVLLGSVTGTLAGNQTVGDYTCEVNITNPA